MRLQLVDSADREQIAFIGLGSNLGDREKSLRQALTLLDVTTGIEVRRVSSFIETEPVGGPQQGRFINAVAEIATSMTPHQLLERLHVIENILGRKREVRWGPRTIDIDILLFGDVIIHEPELTLPHPRMHERDFVLRPLCELAPDAWHPVLHKTAKELLRAVQTEN